MKNTQEEIDDIMKDAREKIEAVLNARGHGWDDLEAVRGYLVSVADRIGTDYADKLVEECNLTEVFNIAAVNTK